MGTIVIAGLLANSCVIVVPGLSCISGSSAGATTAVSIAAEPPYGLQSQQRAPRTGSGFLSKQSAPMRIDASCLRHRGNSIAIVFARSRGRTWRLTLSGKPSSRRRTRPHRLEVESILIGCVTHDHRPGIAAHRLLH